jgi:hypothetical protein
MISGHSNLVSITATKIDAEDSLRRLSVTERKCKFFDETENMTLHKNYSQLNCFMECYLKAAQVFVMMPAFKLYNARMPK